MKYKSEKNLEPETKALQNENTEDKNKRHNRDKQQRYNQCGWNFPGPGEV